MRTLLSLAIAGALGLTVAACDEVEEPTVPDGSADLARQGPPGTVLEIRAVHEDGGYAFEVPDDDIPSGWTTVELDNRTEATHFAFLRKPNSVFLENMRDEFGEVSGEAFAAIAGEPFQEAWDPYFAGDYDYLTFLINLGAGVPAWFNAEHRPIGGPGLTSGGVTSRTTQHLAPGLYFVECYVLGDDGVFHGMVKTFEVTEASSSAREPRPTMRVSIDDDGIEMEGSRGADGVRPGQHTVAVTFEENGTPEGSDLHLIRLDGGTSVAEVNAWMDWADVAGPETASMFDPAVFSSFYDTDDDFGPALTSYHGHPGPQTWLGGVQDIRPPLPVTAYVHVRLEPGDYAWVAELRNPDARGFLKTFTVPVGTQTGD